MYFRTRGIYVWKIWLILLDFCTKQKTYWAFYLESQLAKFYSFVLTFHNFFSIWFESPKGENSVYVLFDFFMQWPLLLLSREFIWYMVHMYGMKFHMDELDKSSSSYTNFSFPFFGQTKYSPNSWIAQNHQISQWNIFSIPHSGSFLFFPPHALLLLMALRESFWMPFPLIHKYTSTL